jgi:hypothetical protein
MVVLGEWGEPAEAGGVEGGSGAPGNRAAALVLLAVTDLGPRSMAS